MLTRVDRLWGAAELRGGQPSVESYDDVIFSPWGVEHLNDPHWGVFDTNGAHIDAAGYYRLPDKYKMGQRNAPELGANSLNCLEGEVHYGGPVILHYGHFVTAFVARLWHIVASGRVKDATIICHCSEPASEWFKLAWVDAILSGLGFRPENFIISPEPVRIRRCIIARPAFEEQSFAYQLFAEFGTTIGHCACEMPSSNRPIYLSKTLLTSSNSRLLNEKPLEEEMERLGCDIVYPERLSFAEQVGLFRSRSKIFSTLSSALHTIFYCNENLPEIFALAPQDEINANFALFDKLKGARASYFRANDTRMIEPTNVATFGFVIDDPVQAARDLMEMGG